MQDCNTLKNLININNKRISILIVEDSKTINDIIVDSLKTLKYKCNTAMTLIETESKLRSTEFQYIILDLNLPDAKDLDLLKRVKQLSDAKIIVFTSSDDFALRDYLFSQGALDYLSKNKPVKENILELSKIIRKTELNKLTSILVIEDSSIIRAQLKDILEPRNYKLYFAENGLQGYQVLKKEAIDLVILDLFLPDIEGFRLLKNIKKNISSQLPVIILSGQSNAEIFRNCIKEGVSDFIKKPFIPEELILKLDLIIEKSEKEQELKCTNQLLDQYKEVVDLSNIVSKADIKGNITFVNDKFEEISGYKKEELIGKTHSIIRHEDMPNDTFKDLWNTIKNDKKPWKGKIKNKKKDGSTYYVDTVINPILDENNNVLEFIAIRMDITARETKKLELQNQYMIKSEKLEDVLSLSKSYEDALYKSSIIIRIDSNKIISYVNDAFCELLGYEKNELIGREYKILKHPEVDPSKFNQMFEYASKKGMWKGQLKNLRKDGKVVHFISTLTPIKNKYGEITEYMGVRLDITELMNLNDEITGIQKETIFKMGEIAESRSEETGYHVKRVAEYTRLLALKAGVSKEESELLFLASPMHDIGKIGIPDSILNKPGKLTPEEFKHMKEHSSIGFNLLKDSNREIFKTASIIAYEHHEKWDGTGYPRGLKGNDIHIYGRITAICDVFDALAHDRVYKKAWELEEIFSLLKDSKGTHFDPNLIDILFDNIDDFLRVKSTFDS